MKRIDDIENYRIPRPFIKEFDSIYDMHYSSKKNENYEKPINKEGEHDLNSIEPQNKKIKEFFLEEYLSKKKEIFLKSNSNFFSTELYNNLEYKVGGGSKDLDETEDDIIKIEENSLESKYVEVMSQFKVRSTNINMKEFNAGASKKFQDNAIMLNLSANHEINMVRLSSEFKMLRRELPVFLTNSIFLAHDETYFDKIMFLIIGAENTPYANGAFIFKLQIPPNYPQIPPICEIMTGRGNVRFNPNLYQEGKVCLSLLGTWKGKESETWDANKSNIFQILLSLQSLVMTKNVLINEPGYNTYRRRNSNILNRGYCNIVKYANINYAMIEYLKNPPECLKDAILNHFFYKKNRILEVCDKWLKRTSKECSYQNTKWSSIFSSEKQSYHEYLEKSVNELKYLLENLKLD